MAEEIIYMELFLKEMYFNRCVSLPRFQKTSNITAACGLIFVLLSFFKNNKPRTCSFCQQNVTESFELSVRSVSAIYPDVMFLF